MTCWVWDCVCATLEMVEWHSLVGERRLIMTIGSSAMYFGWKFAKVIAAQRKMNSETDNEVGLPAQIGEVGLLAAMRLL